MRQKQKKHKYGVFRTVIEAIIIILIILAAFNILSSIYVNPGDAIQYQIDSPLETYIFENPYNVSRIVIASTYIVFNNTGFNITSTNPINIQINHIDEDIGNPSSDNDDLLVFTITNTPGATWFNLSGFEPASGYRVKINDVFSSGELANDTGVISFYDTPTLNDVYSIFSDSIAPNITINFAGNLGDSGGPYWRPPSESTQLTGIWSDGYYTNDSRQSEGWMYINLTVEDSGGVPDVWLQWKNESTWTNYTYKFTNRTGGYFDINTSNNFSTAEGCNYSFNIVANDTSSNSKTVWWNKTAIYNGTIVRRTVQLNCTSTNISYIPYYLFNAPSYKGTPGDTLKHDRLHHDQGADGSIYDTGILTDDVPTDTINLRLCAAYLGYWFDESVCAESFTLNNIYYHFWWSSDETGNNINWTGYKKQRKRLNQTTTEYYSPKIADSPSIIIYDNGWAVYSNDYYLNARLQILDNPVDFTDNDIYELAIKISSVFPEGVHPTVISNRSIISFILFNVPDNATLNTSHADTDSDSLSDWTELYVTYTSPFLADTDNDGLTDYWEYTVNSDPNDYTEAITLTLSGESPTNNSIDILINPSLHVICNSGGGSDMTATWRSNSSGTWVDFATNGSISTGTNITQDNSNFSNYSTTYWWSINLTDGYNWTNETYHFTTLSNTAPSLSSPSPSNGSTGVSISTSLISVAIADSETTFNWTITTSPNIGSDSANNENDGTKTCTISGLNYDAIYYWTVTAYDGVIWTNATYHFTVESDPSGGGGEPPINSAPVISEEYPEDESVNVVLQPYCHVKVTDANSDNSDINFYNSTDGITYYWQQKNSSVSTGTTVYWDYTQASEYNTLYYWRVYADDGTINISRIFSFTTYPDNPVITSYSPADGAVDVTRNTTITVTIFDYQGDTMNITWRSDSSGSWVDFGYNNSVNNGTYSQRFINSTGYNTQYWWSVNITGSWTNATYSFTTELNVIPVVSDPIPRDGKLRVSIYTANLSVVITDANSDFNYTIETSPDVGSISENNVGSGVKTCTISGLNYSTVYTWYVNVTDGEFWTNVSYTFTTKGATDFDIEGFKFNLPEWAMGPYKVYVGDFIWMFLFVGVIAITWGSSRHISSTFIVILLTFAAYGTQRVFVDNSEISLLFSIIAAVCIAAIMLGLFLKKRYG